MANILTGMYIDLETNLVSAFVKFYFSMRHNIKDAILIRLCFLTADFQKPVLYNNYMYLLNHNFIISQIIGVILLPMF